MLGLFTVKRRVIEGDVDAGFECFVDDADAISGEEEDPTVILEDSEEYCDS